MNYKYACTRAFPRACQSLLNIVHVWALVSPRRVLEAMDDSQLYSQ